jgi:hypothetical protein
MCLVVTESSLMSVVSGTSQGCRGGFEDLHYGSMAKDGILERFIYIESLSTVIF